MGHIENTIFENNNEIKPINYICQIFLEITSEEKVKKMETISIVKFTYKLNKSKKLMFLDVPLDNTTNLNKTSVYRKKTDKEICLNYSRVIPGKMNTPR